MIKVANNIQSMLARQAQNAVPNYISSVPASRLPAENFFSPFQRELQLSGRLANTDLNRMMQYAHQGYSDMVGPYGIPLALAQGGQFADDAQNAGPALAQDYNNYINMQTQAVNQLGGIGNNALNYVEANIPQAQGYARNVVDAGTAALNQVAPAMQAQQQSVQDQAAGLGSRIKSIGQGLFKNPLGR